MKAISIQPFEKPIKSELTIPGSKSYTNRSLLLAALTKGTVNIINPLISDDTKALISCLKRLGIKISDSNKYIKVESDISSVKNRAYKLDANLSGTTIRFMLALSTIIPGTKILFGKEGLNKRPIGDLVDGLRQLGAKIEYLKKKDFPPIRVLSSKLNSGTIKIKGSVSSQYISAILMISPSFGEVTIEIIGNQISKPYIDMTIDIMKQFGVVVSNENYKRYKVPGGQKYDISKYFVEGDYSSASYFFAIAALTKSTITVKNLNSKSAQADKKFLDILEKMGSKIMYGKNQITVIGKGIKPINVDMEDCPDQAQTLAVLAAFAKGVTKISGAQSLRVKETNRILAIKKELKKMGIRTLSTANTLTIYGGNPKAARIETYGDHRMAMSFAVAGAKIPGMEIIDPEVVNKTFPTFWEKLNSIGVNAKIIENKNIILIGMRGSGKTTVGKLLAKKLNKKYLELDEIIVKRVGLTIPEIVKKYGWNFFRDKESEVVKEVSLQSDKVISTGGGIAERAENITALSQNGLFIFLNASLETLVKRIGNDTNRPFLTKVKNREEEIKKLLQDRLVLYKKAADKIIETDSITPVKVAEEIISILRGKTKICMVIGNPIQHSLSPKMHNAAFKALGIDKDFVFVASQVRSEDLSDFIKGVRAKGIRGVSVTIPHKTEIIKFLDKVDKVAKKIGAVNTVVNNDSVLTGYNTDWLGASLPLEKITSLEGKIVALIGAGGTARAAAYAVTKSGAKLTIYNRSLKEAKKLAEEFDGEVCSLDNLEKVKDADIIFNTTPVGMYPDVDETPLPAKLIRKNQIVFDAIYTPFETKLLRDAKKRGAQIILGAEMFVMQGAAQFELFTNFKAPLEVMRKALEDALK